MKKPQLLDDKALEQVTGGADLTSSGTAGPGEEADIRSGTAMFAGINKKTIKEYPEYTVTPDIGTI